MLYQIEDISNSGTEVKIGDVIVMPDESRVEVVARALGDSYDGVIAIWKLHDGRYLACHGMYDSLAEAAQNTLIFREEGDI